MFTARLEGRQKIHILNNSIKLADLIIDRFNKTCWLLMIVDKWCWLLLKGLYWTKPWYHCFPVIFERITNVLIRSLHFLNSSPELKFTYIYLRLIVNKHADIQTNWHRQTNGHKKKKKKYKANTVVNSVPPDTEFLYYPLNVEGIILKGSAFSSRKKKD